MRFCIFVLQIKNACQVRRFRLSFHASASLSHAQPLNRSESNLEGWLSRTGPCNSSLILKYLLPMPRHLFVFPNSLHLCLECPSIFHIDMVCAGHSSVHVPHAQRACTQSVIRLHSLKWVERNECLPVQLKLASTVLLSLGSSR